MIRIRFMTVKGPFKTAKEQVFDTFEQAKAAVETYAAENGFSKVKLACANEDDLDEYRFTATSPGGRAGRNIAFGEYP